MLGFAWQAKTPAANSGGVLLGGYLLQVVPEQLGHAGDLVAESAILPHDADELTWNLGGSCVVCGT